jgi:hypothetical protein
MKAHKGSNVAPNAVDSNTRSPIAESVSLESVVNLLIRKGFCTPEELYDEEEKRQRELPGTTQATPVRIADRHSDEEASATAATRKGSWLKRKMSKRRWTRRLGTRLFGWEWKKVKVKQRDIVLERIATRLNDPG